MKKAKFESSEIAVCAACGLLAAFAIVMITFPCGPTVFGIAE